METDISQMHPYFQASLIDWSGVFEALSKYKKQKMGTNNTAGLPDKLTGLSFNEAMKAMHDGFKVRLPEWTGYWFMNNGEMSLLSRTGDILNTPDFKKFSGRDDWEVAIVGMGFDFAVLALKAGKLVAREAWTKQLIFIRPSHTMTIGYALNTDQSLPPNLKSWFQQKVDESKLPENGPMADMALQPINFSGYLCSMDSNRNITNGWTPTQDDLTANDWTVIQVPEWKSSIPPYNKFDSQQA